MRQITFFLLMLVATFASANESNGTENTVICSDSTQVIQPSFPGGQDALNAFFNKHLRYPQELSPKRGIEGTVEVHFIVEEDGSVNLRDYKFNNMNMKIERKEAECFIKEVRRVFKLMPKWNPGMIDGVAKKVKLTQKVNFHLP